MGRQVAGSKSKATESDHLAQVAKQLGKDVEEIERSNDFAPFPTIAGFVWDNFMDLHDGRSYGMNGPENLDYRSIKAWCDLTGIELSPWELKTIKSLDSIWIKSRQ
jgi:hypothetical protein